MFTEPPLDFEQGYRRALRIEIGPGLPAAFVGYEDLRELKRKSDRPQDLADLDQLTRIKNALQE